MIMNPENSSRDLLPLIIQTSYSDSESHIIRLLFDNSRFFDLFNKIQNPIAFDYYHNLQIQNLNIIIYNNLEKIINNQTLTKEQKKRGHRVPFAVTFSVFSMFPVSLVVSLFPLPMSQFPRLVSSLDAFFLQPVVSLSLRLSH